MPRDFDGLNSENLGGRVATTGLVHYLSMADSAMAESPDAHSALYDHFGWQLRAAQVEVGHGRLAETHEYFHRQLDDTTAFGGLLGTVAALADALPDSRWAQMRRQLQDMSDLVHETFAVGMSLLTTQRRLEPIENYPTYDRHVRTARRLVGTDVHPWVALAALRSAAVSSMQSAALRLTRISGLTVFTPSRLSPMERPNHRLATLLKGSFSDLVLGEQAQAKQTYGSEPWWQPVGEMLLSPDSMDGAAAAAFSLLMRRLIDQADDIIRSSGGTAVAWDAHHDDLRALLVEARQLAPGGLARIGALVESPGGELLHGGPLDGQILELTATPARAVVLPYGTASATSGEGERKHAFLVVTTPRRLRSGHEVDGVALPETEVVACMRSTVFDGDKRDSLLLLIVEGPKEIQESVPIHLSVFSSAAAADPTSTTAWMRWANVERVSLVMDTPVTAALRRWCAEGARFVCATRQIQLDQDDVRIIVGRIEQPGRRSPLVIIPTTEFGARWFESACAEDPVLNSTVVESPDLFERESEHLDVALTHLLLEERFLGTGSWRR